VAPRVVKGMPDVTLSREVFAERFRARFYDPAFDAAKGEIDKLLDIAWKSYSDSNKSPRTRKAGKGFADPDYDLSVEWIEASRNIAKAQARHDDKSKPSRILIINGSSRSDQTCPGEMSKTMGLRRISSTSAASHPNTGASSIPARPVSPPRCRSAIGRARVTRTMRSPR
jgi:hypothetical protein